MNTRDFSLGREHRGMVPCARGIGIHRRFDACRSRIRTAVFGALSHQGERTAAAKPPVRRCRTSRSVSCTDKEVEEQSDKRLGRNKIMNSRNKREKVSDIWKRQASMTSRYIPYPRCSCCRSSRFLVIAPRTRRLKKCHKQSSVIHSLVHSSLTAVYEDIRKESRDHTYDSNSYLYLTIHRSIIGVRGPLMCNFFLDCLYSRTLLGEDLEFATGENFTGDAIEFARAKLEID